MKRTLDAAKLSDSTRKSSESSQVSGEGRKFSGSGSYSGSSNPATITMNGTIAETATFNRFCAPEGLATTSGFMGSSFLTAVGMLSGISVQRRSGMDSDVNQTNPGPP